LPLRKNVFGTWLLAPGPRRSTGSPQPKIQLTPAGEKAIAAYDPFKDDPDPAFLKPIVIGFLSHTGRRQRLLIWAPALVYPLRNKLLSSTAVEFGWKVAKDAEAHLYSRFPQP
jgi:hypothetical protein